MHGSVDLPCLVMHHAGPFAGSIQVLLHVLRWVHDAWLWSSESGADHQNSKE